ncbi:nuclear transport factor 2 family protein [Pseudonocardia humida]|uniref:Nuclear transport factor 2 family protein n=1 Tax=Pseudonocardia humida TaxID=2800819 RepID=A0ABT0ZX77_9PSEU|nr:nuclear transport factor 2 family protein [Pseudonocardia humida]MCO1655259.1 nuclear transport factor 2 family protein [Pseudonocardia humida]
MSVDTAIAGTVSEYLRAWNVTDPAERVELLSRVATDDVRYVDPLADVTGPAALSALIGQAQAQFAGMPLTLHGTPDAHHDVVRFSWAIAPEGAEPIVIGTDSVLLAPDGRFALVTGYLDRVPG